MTRIETACFGLIASAFILAGLLIVQVSSTPNTAEAGMVITREHFTLLTAKSRNKEDALFVINNITRRLQVYRLDIGRKRIELSSVSDLGEIFSRGFAGGEKDRRGGGTR